MNREKWRQRRPEQSPVLRSNHCAVLVPIVTIEKEPSLLFEVRSNKLDWQPGDICFPGGSLEATDPTPEAGAIRETVEELGIQERHIQVLGPLDYLESPVGLTIWPFAACLNTTQFSVNSAEVEEMFTVPIQWFLQHEPEVTAMEVATRPTSGFPEGISNNETRRWRQRSFYDIYIYRFSDKVIWGITAHIVRDFIRAYRFIEL
jgi:8-oxo-dGTP pyrophosphatase MutT (NUDIX family)